MNYPNAAKGIKSIYISEILKLVGVIITIGGGSVALVSFTAALQDSAAADASSTLATIGVVGAVLLLAGLGMLLVSAILNIVGIAKASRDEDSFKTAILFVILSIACSAGSVMLANVQVTVSGFLNAASGLLNLFAYIMVIGGIIRIADRMNRSDVSAIGNLIFRLVIAIQLVELLVAITAPILTTIGFGADAIFVVVLVLIGKVLELIQVIMYLMFLSKAKKMLAK